MAMTDAQLQGVGAQALNMAKRDREKGSFNFLLASYHESDTPPLHRMDRIEALIIERLGEDWLNHGSTKDLGFYVLRLAVNTMPPDAVVIVTGCVAFNPTGKFHKLPPAEQATLFNAGHDIHEKAVQDGLLRSCDILLATVQTPERVCLYQQEITQRVGPVTRFMNQTEFGGRLKMFGVEPGVKFEYEA
jgi:hypothetical protein